MRINTTQTLRRSRFHVLSLAFLKIQHGTRLATSNLIGSFLEITPDLSVVIVIAIVVRKAKPCDPYNYDFTTTLKSMIFGSHQVLTLLTTTIAIAITITMLV